MTCPLPFEVLEIGTWDRTTEKFIRVDLLNPYGAFYCIGWRPQAAELKGEGIWSDSPLAHGRRLKSFKRQNVTEAYTLAVREHTPDDLVQATRDLRTLLERAREYGATAWHDEPVWIRAVGRGETNARYAVIHNYDAPEDTYPYSDEFWGNISKAAIPQFALTLEHDPAWTADRPGTGSCVQASGVQAWVSVNWTNNTAQPVGSVFGLFETAGGFMLAADTAEVWRTNTGVAPWTAATAKPAGSVLDFVETGGWIYCITTSGVYRSNDNGNNWALRSNQMVGVNTAPHCLTVGDDGYLYGVGQFVGANGIHRSNDGGATWATVYRSVTVIGAIYQASDGYIYAGREMVVRSANGTAWYIVAGFYPPASYRIKKFIESGGWLIAVGTGPATSGFVARSLDGSEGSWGVCATTGEALWDVIAPSYGGLLACGANATVYYGGAEGDMWKPFVTTGPATIWSLAEFSVTTSVFAGEDGDVYEEDRTDYGALGRAATCLDEVFVANKQNVAQLTHVKVYDASAVPPADYTDQLPAGAFPFALLPFPLALNDAIYVGIDTSVMDSGPFCSVIWDVGQPFICDPAVPHTMSYEYWNGAWVALTVMDRTAVNYPFELSGVNGFHFVPPSDWATTAVDGVTAFWIRVRCSLLGTVTQCPTQQNRDVYTVTWPDALVDEAQVGGDMPALLEFRLQMRSDKDGPGGSAPDLWANRVMCGLRSSWRGEQFTSFVNLADEQNPIGITVTAGTGTVFGDDMEAPSGRRMVHTTTGNSAWEDIAIITFSPSIARDFYGRFHALLRAQEVDRSAAMGEVLLRLKVVTGSGGLAKTTVYRPFPNLNPWQVLDFKGIDFPASGLLRYDELGDESRIIVQAWSSVASLTVNLWDLALVPTDEWSIDTLDVAFEDDSGIDNGYLLDMDSLIYHPKCPIRTTVRTADASLLVRSIYDPITPGPAILQEGTDQALWFFAARGIITGTHDGGGALAYLSDSNASFLTSNVKSGMIVYNVTDGTTMTGTTVVSGTRIDGTLSAGTWDNGDVYYIICPNWRSDPQVAFSLQAWHNARYISMRGSG